MAERNYVKAREQFQRLLAENPGNADVAVAVGLLSMELRDYEVAESNFKKALVTERYASMAVSISLVFS